MPNFMRRPSLQPARGARRAFTLIELLVVIAIISILVALLFPVFATARESARESATSTHLHEIQNALALYKLDNKSYPPVLFGYAACTPLAPATTCSVAPMSAAVQNGAAGLTGLYPTYVKDWHDFTCPNNLVEDLASQPPSITTRNVNVLTASNGNLASQAEPFYEMDAMDISPQVDTTNNNRLVNGSNAPTWQWIPRYQTTWDSYRTANDFPTSTACMAATPPASCLTQSQYSIYTRQLHWTNPPPNTYVTSLTYHVPNRNVVMVLYESGTVVTSTKIGVGTPVTNYDDSVNDISAPTAGATPDSPAKFWQFSAGQ